MASKSGSVFSETLQTITTTKLEELTKQRKSFEENCAALLASTKAEHDPLKRVCLLQDGVKSCLGIQTKAATSSEGRSGGAAYGGARNIRLDTDLKNLDRFLEQARFDPSVSIKVLGDWEATLLRYLEVQSTKFQYADLYGKLVTEWLSSEKTVPIDNDVEMSESFEEIPGAKKLAARTEWEKKVFEPAVVDVPSLELYLSQLFDMDSKAGVTAVRTLLREKVEAFEKRLRQTSQFTTHTLATTIRTLQKSDLLSDSKREALKDFLSNDVILAEIADILNIRMAALDKWTWGDHVIIEQRRMLNGNFNIQFDPDLLQAIFLHYIGTKWSVFFKTTFKAILDTDVWKKPHVEVSKLDRKRRAYFLGPQGTAKNNNLQNKRMRIYRNRYFAHQLLDYDAQDIELQDGEEEAEYASYAQAPLQAQMQGQSAYGAQRMQLQSMAGMVRQTARKSTGGHAPPWAANEGIELDFVDERDEEDMKDIDSEEEAESDNYQHKAKKPMETKQKLLHLVSTELILNTRLHQDFTCFRTAFDSWNPLLPHDTITTVLKFFGVSSKWMNFFVKFLQAPLKFADDQSAEPRLRRRGAPGSHALSDVLSEVVFFCLDFSVNKATDGSVIHRLYDDLWFWNKDYDKCEEAWAKVLEFKDAMTVNLDEKKTGSIRVANDESLTTGVRLPQGEIRWGFLVLDSKTGRFEIDEKMVDDHVEELRKQLDGKSKSVIDWIQAWNSYAATFFSSNFGQASNSFGREHVDKMLATHRRVQERIFQGGNVVQYLKSLIKNRFGVMDIPDGFLFFPVELGGLDLKSPFVDLLQIRESVTGDPFKLLDEFVEQEQDDYVSAKHKFDKGDVHQWNKQRGGSIWEPEDADVFFPFTEYIKYREEFSRVGKANLRATFSKLLERPKEEPILSTTEMRLAIEDLRNQNNLRGILGYWESMDSYWKWIAQMYGPEMTEKFGGLSVVDFGLLPIGMVSMFRQRRTKWQG